MLDDVDLSHDDPTDVAVYNVLDGVNKLGQCCLAILAPRSVQLHTKSKQDNIMTLGEKC